MQEVALRHPQLVRKLLLLGTGLRGGDPNMEPKVLEVAPRPVPTVEDFLYLFFGAPTPPSRLGGVLGAPPPAGRPGPAQLARRSPRHRSKPMPPTCRPLPGENPYAYLNAITQPTLVLNGDNDVMIPTINSWHLAQNIPNAQLLIYPDAGHGAQFQYPERFLKHAIQFLAE